VGFTGHLDFLRGPLMLVEEAAEDAPALDP
jgi:hypothetical protein